MNRKWGKIIWIVGIVGLVCFMAVRLWIGREPRYQGRALSSWLKDLDQPNGGPAPALAVTALHSMAPKASVRLVSMLEAEDPPMVLWLVNLAQKQSYVRIPFTPASTRIHRAELAFDILPNPHVRNAGATISVFLMRMPEGGGAFPGTLGSWERLWLCAEGGFL